MEIIEKLKNHLLKEKYNYIIIFLLIIMGGVIYYSTNLILEETPKNYELENVVANVEEEDVQEEVIEKIKVDIKGKIANPGVYEVLSNAIVDDVIKLAGGVTKSGTTTNINLSKKVSNEMVIIIYSTTELKNINNPPVSSTTCPTYNIEECPNSSVIEVGDNATSKTDSSNESKKVSINTATKEELMTLNGIGEAKAESIIEYRKQNPFNSIEDIKNISGIGDAIFDKIKDSITI